MSFENLKSGISFAKDGIEARQVGKLQQHAHGDKTDAGDQQGSGPVQQRAPHEDCHGIQREIVAIEIAGEMDDGSDQNDIKKNLQIGL